MPYLEAMVIQYAETALWSSMDDEGRPLEDNYGLEDIAPESLAAMRADCATFIGDLLGACEEHRYPMIPAGNAGHDFWLTRNRHGAGFWDGDYPEALGKLLTDVSHAYGEQDIYVGDDGKLYVS
jgi:hypothetical protein